MERFENWRWRKKIEVELLANLGLIKIHEDGRYHLKLVHVGEPGEGVV